MTTKTKPRKKQYVRIVIDDKLAAAIEIIQQELPLLSTAEAVKIVLSQNLTSIQKTLSNLLAKLKQTNPVQKDLSEDEMFAE
jgi:hypothetical protein